MSTTARQLREGDLFSFTPMHQDTVWLVTEISRYSNGEMIVHVNGPAPGLKAVFTLPPSMWVYFR